MVDGDEIQLTIEGVFRLINSGQFGAAEEYCRSYLEQTPNDVNVLALLGAVLLKLGRASEAEPVLLSATRLEPEFAKPFEDLGALYLGSGELSEAVNHYEQAIRLDGSQASAWSGLADALMRSGATDRARAARRKFLELSPTARALDEANRQKQLGDPARAEHICEDILRSEPANTDALRLLASIATEDERFVVAEGLLKRLVKLSSDHYLAYSELGRFLGDRGRIPEAIEQLAIATELDPTIVENHRVLGDLMSIIGHQTGAEAAYQRALHLDPEDPAALAGLGHTLRILGRRDEALAAYERCLVTRPDAGDAWWSLATMSGCEFSAAQIDIMRNQLDSTDIDENARVSLLFAIGRSAEARNQFEEAWEYYEQGNLLKRGLIQHDPVRNEILHDAVIETFDREFLSPGTSANDAGPAPIFIVGMPRAGSTLLEQILASHSQVEGTGELPYIIMLTNSIGDARPGSSAYPEALRNMTADQLLALGQSYLYHTRSQRRQDVGYFTDKMPANFTHIGLIHLALPNARIIDARRHPLDTCIGNFRQLFARGKNHAYDLFELAEYYLQYHRIMDHWDEVLPGRVLRVQYEDVVADVEGQTRRMLEYCGLPWEDACLEFFSNERPVNTASSEQVRQPIYAKSVGYWKHYESKLTEIKEILGPSMPALSRDGN